MTRFLRWLCRVTRVDRSTPVARPYADLQAEARYADRLDPYGT